MKKNTFLVWGLTIACSLLQGISCKKDSTTPANPAKGFKLLTSGYAIGAATKVLVYAADSATTGYNNLNILLEDSVTGNFVNNAQITLAPTMIMPGMSMVTPLENPASASAVNNLFPCSATFTMASMTNCSWNLVITVQNLINNKSGTATLPVSVNAPNGVKLFSFKYPANSQNTFYAGLVAPLTPVMGINNFELVIYKYSMMMFKPDSSLTVSFIPSMPSMPSMGTPPNNVNPVHIGNGHYKGAVNFSMTGAWRLNMTLNAGNTKADSTHYFDISF